MNKVEQKIIYSKKVMQQLLERGFRPIDTFQNPIDPRYMCWAFEKTEMLENALEQIFYGGGAR